MPQQIEIDDEFTLQLFRILEQACADVPCKFIIVGAYARDLICQRLYGLSPRRHTSDIDIGVLIESWSDFERLSTILVESYGFDRGHYMHEFLRPSLRLDVIPFGRVEDATHHITWPKSDRSMNMSGFSEAYQHAIEIQIAGGGPVRLPNLVALLVLKFISWNDRPAERAHDAEDASYILEIFWEIPDTQDKIYGSDSDLLDSQPFVQELACARLIAREIRKQFSDETLELLKKILTDRAKLSILFPQMRVRSANPTLIEQQIEALIDELDR